MASEPVEDDDAWLYGDSSTAEEQRKEEINAIFERAAEVAAPVEESAEKITQNGDISQEAPPDTEPIENGEDVEKEEGEEERTTQDDEDKDSDEDDDSDDDVQITIGDIKPATAAYPYGGAPVNLNIKRGSAFSSGAGSSIKQKGLDVDTIGVINGLSIYEFNLDTIEDKPWRKPGADITDYFNYGFNEDTWKLYCEKQRKLRLENSLKAPVVVVPGKDQQIPIATVNENSKYSGFMPAPKKAGPPPGRRTSGSIDVICGANSSNRRTGNAKENVIQVMTGRTENYDATVPGSMPPTHIPPPFIPNLSVPPPGLPPGIPPPTIPPPGTVPGHVPFPDLYGNPIFSQPPPPVGVSVDVAPQYDEQFFTGSSSHGYDNSETQHSWGGSSRERDRERDRDRDRDRERHRDRSRDKDRDRDHYASWERGHDRDRSAGRGPNDEEYMKRREEYERRKYREYRERREKERYDRDHERDRDRERDYYERDERRDSRERDRERKPKDYKDREDRHRDRSSRRHRHHDDDEDHHSSRHKHKKSKREKEETNSVADVSDNASQQEPEIEEKV